MLTILPLADCELGNGRPALWHVRYGPHGFNAYVGINSAHDCPLEAIASLLGIITFKSPVRVVMKKATKVKPPTPATARSGT